VIPTQSRGEKGEGKRSSSHRYRGVLLPLAGQAKRVRRGEGWEFPAIRIPRPLTGEKKNGGGGGRGHTHLPGRGRSRRGKGKKGEITDALRAISVHPNPLLSLRKRKRRGGKEEPAGAALASRGFMLRFPPWRKKRGKERERECLTTQALIPINIFSFFYFFKKKEEGGGENRPTTAPRWISPAKERRREGEGGGKMAADMADSLSDKRKKGRRRRRERHNK